MNWLRIAIRVKASKEEIARSLEGNSPPKNDGQACIKLQLQK